MVLWGSLTGLVDGVLGSIDVVMASIGGLIGSLFWQVVCFVSRLPDAQGFHSLLPTGRCAGLRVWDLVWDLVSQLRWSD